MVNTKTHVSRRRNARMPRVKSSDAPPLDATVETVEFKRVQISPMTQRRIKAFAADAGITIPAAYGVLLLAGLQFKTQERKPNEQPSNG